MNQAPHPRPTLLWVDCTAGFLAGVTVLALSEWLSRLHGLPRELLLYMGAANLLYATGSFTLARAHRRPLALVALLATANGAWAIVCVALAVAHRAQATPYGIAHLAIEAAFVGGLGAMEWHRRHALATAPAAPIA